MPDTARTFSEPEHFALVTDAVKRETAAVTAERDELKQQLAAEKQRADVLEAEKASAVTERDKVTADFEAFKKDVEEKAAVAARKEDRVKAVKAANQSLDEEYFTAERAQRWAEMDEDTFKVLLDGISAPTAAKAPETPKPETAAFTGGTSPSAPEGNGSVLGKFLGLRHGQSATTS